MFYKLSIEPKYLEFVKMDGSSFGRIDNNNSIDIKTIFCPERSGKFKFNYNLLVYGLTTY